MFHHVFSEEIFNSTPDFYDVRWAEQRIIEVVHQFGDIIVSHGLHAVFGVALLHRHFGIRPGEIVIRHYASKTFSEVDPKTGKINNLQPYLWRYVRGPEGTGFYPIEFCRYTLPADIIRYRAQMTHCERRPEFFEEFSEKLVELDCAGIVALTGLHTNGAFTIGPNETLLELTDEKNRHTTLSVVSEQTVTNTRDTTQTLWYFTPNAVLHGTSCATHCYGHCNAHDNETEEK